MEVTSSRTKPTGSNSSWESLITFQRLAEITVHSLAIGDRNRWQSSPEGHATNSLGVNGKKRWATFV